MPSEKRTPALTYANGNLHGRMATEDESEGFVQLVPGREYRCNVDLIGEYHAEEQGVVMMWINGRDDPRLVIGTVAELDDVKKRHRTHVVKTS